MKTHQEIRDAINQAELMPSEDTTGGIFKILHALNDRIEEVHKENLGLARFQQWLDTEIIHKS